MISGLCGASLSEIENDYCSSIEMGIYEYRGPGAVRYSLQNLLGVTFIEEVENLQESLIRALSKNDKIMREKINKMIDRLKK